MYGWEDAPDKQDPTENPEKWATFLKERCTNCLHKDHADRLCGAKIYGPAGRDRCICIKRIK